MTVAAIVTIIMERRILNDNIGTEVDIMQNQFLTNYTEVTFLDKLKPKKYAEKLSVYMKKNPPVSILPTYIRFSASYISD